MQVFYSKCHPFNGLPRIPTEGDLRELIVKISLLFDEVTLVIDGLDEVGSAISLDRLHLIQALSTLHKTPSTIRTIILSRDEPDINRELAELDDVSIAATSGDLKLYVSAKMSLLNIKNPSLKLEVHEALVSGAQGM